MISHRKRYRYLKIFPNVKCICDFQIYFNSAVLFLR